VIAQTYGTISDIEIVWVIIALAGAIFSAYNLHCAWGDLKVLLALNLPPNGRRDIAISTVLVESCRITIQIIFATIGILAMFLEEPPMGVLTTLQIVTGAAFRWGLIISSLLITAQSIINFTIRKRAQRRVAHG
jgi:hypothetical protein